jgi:hypothetical protein
MVGGPAGLNSRLLNLDSLAQLLGHGHD